jgi:hemerythrin
MIINQEQYITITLSAAENAALHSIIRDIARSVYSHFDTEQEVFAENLYVALCNFAELDD